MCGASGGAGPRALLCARDRRRRRPSSPLRDLLDRRARHDDRRVGRRPCQSHWFSVGIDACPGPRRAWARSRRSRSSSRRTARRSSRRIRGGERGTNALVAEIDADTLRDVRQVLVIDAKGNAGVYTGEGCMPFCGPPCRDATTSARGNLLCRRQGLGPDGRGVRERAGRARRSDARRPRGRTGRRRRLARHAVGRDRRRARWSTPRSRGRTGSSTCGSRTTPSRSPNSKRLYVIRRAYDLADQGDNAFATKDYAAGDALLRRRRPARAAERRADLLARLDEDGDGRCERGRRRRRRRRSS